MLARWIAPIEFMTDAEIDELKDEDWIDESDWFYADFIAGGRLDEHPTYWMPLPSKTNRGNLHQVRRIPLPNP